MSDVIAPTKTVTFTITKMPSKRSLQKTLSRLMRMQPDVRSGLKKLQGQRRRVDNRTYIRAGNWWTDRKKATHIARPGVGETFTLKLTPQIMADIRSIESYVDASAA